MSDDPHEGNQQASGAGQDIHERSRTSASQTDFSGAPWGALLVSQIDLQKATADLIDVTRQRDSIQHIIDNYGPRRTGIGHDHDNDRNCLQKLQKALKERDDFQSQVVRLTAAARDADDLDIRRQSAEARATLAEMRANAAETRSDVQRPAPDHDCQQLLRQALDAQAAAEARAAQLQAQIDNATAAAAAQNASTTASQSPGSHDNQHDQPEGSVNNNSAGNPAASFSDPAARSSNPAQNNPPSNPAATSSGAAQTAASQPRRSARNRAAVNYKQTGTKRPANDDGSGSAKGARRRKK